MDSAAPPAHVQGPGEQNDLFASFSSMPVIMVNYKAPTMTMERQIDFVPSGCRCAQRGRGDGHPDFTPGNGPAGGGC